MRVVTLEVSLDDGGNFSSTIDATACQQLRGELGADMVGYLVAHLAASIVRARPEVGMDNAIDFVIGHAQRFAHTNSVVVLTSEFKSVS